MGKLRRGAKEISREQKFAHENKMLKRELSQLRKQLARIDLDRYDSVKEMLEEHNPESQAHFGAEFLENLKKTWLCNDCRQGYLEIIIYNKVNATFYYRQCTHCPNRTTSQKYDSEKVKGIVKDAAVSSKA